MTERQTNTHMTHVEDNVIKNGVDGTRKAIESLRHIRDMLSGTGRGGVSVKWDGAPSIIAGTDPRDGLFFVGTKGVFNKTPKLYKTQKDIDAVTERGLSEKLRLALTHFRDLGIQGVIQGDLLFTKHSIQYRKINGLDYLTFHPNTVVYGVPATSQTASQIKKAEIGVVWHTSYSGSSFDTMEASYGVDVSKLNKTPSVWQQDAILRDLNKIGSLDTHEIKSLSTALTGAGKTFNQITGEYLSEMGGDKSLGALVDIFNNQFIRAGVDSDNKSVEIFDFVHSRFEKEIQNRKTDKGKATQIQKRDRVTSFLSKDGSVPIRKIFELQKFLNQAKLILINRLNRAKDIDTFVLTADGYRDTGHEGYVFFSEDGKTAMKLVDRLEFSKNNFSPDVIKGWSK